jgi:hypothetical protein
MLIGEPEPSWLALLVRAVIVGGLGIATYAALAVALRIPELPSIVGVMADLLRRPRRV